MKKTGLSVLLCCVLLLTACSTIPEEVSRDNEILNSVAPIDKSELNEDNYERLSMGEIRNSIKKTLSENNTNVIPGKVIVTEGNSMPAYKVSPFYKNFELDNIVKYLMNEDFTLDEPYCRYHKKGTVSDKDSGSTWGFDVVYYLGSAQKYTQGLVVHETGTMFYYSTPIDAPNRDTDIAPTEKRYRLYLGDELDGSSFKLRDGSEWSVNAAAEYALDFVNDFLAPLENNEFTYSVSEFRVKDLGDGFGYVVDLQRLSKNGNYIDNRPVYFNVNYSLDYFTHKPLGDSWIEKGYPYFYSSQIQVCFQAKEKVFSFAKAKAPYTGEQVTDGEELISLKSAIDIVSGNMADLSIQEFEYTELAYFYVAMDCNSYDENGQPYQDDDHMLYTSDIQLRPYWAFVKEDCWPDMQGGEGGNEPAKKDRLFLVDAITGQFILL